MMVESPFLSLNFFPKKNTSKFFRVEQFYKPSRLVLTKEKTLTYLNQAIRGHYSIENKSIENYIV